MSDVGAVLAAMEPFCSDFDRWPTVIIHSVYVHVCVCVCECAYDLQVNESCSYCCVPMHVQTFASFMHCMMPLLGFSD